MPEKLRHLLESHEFLRSALRLHGKSMQPSDVARMKSECDEHFLELLRHASKDPRITLTQIRFMVESLAELAGNDSIAQLLKARCIDAVARLTERDPPGAVPTPRPTKSRIANTRQKVPKYCQREELALLDSLSDRLVVMSRDYRYVFTNRANAAFHGLKPEDMIGSPVWSVVGQRCFKSLTKPMLDDCFMGHRFTLYVRHTYRAPSITCSVLFDPVRDDSGEVVSAMVSARDVTSLPIPEGQIWHMSGRGQVRPSAG